MENTRPSRRELRLARQAQRLEQTASKNHSSAPVKPVNDLVDTGESTAILTAISDDFSKRVEPASVDSSAFRLQRVVRLGKFSFAIPKSPYLAPRVILATGCAFFTALGGGVAIGSLSFDSSASALATIGEVATSSLSMESTPENLKATDGAADSARFHAYEKQFDGSPIVCETTTSANSLTSVLRDQVDKIIYPMPAGTYQKTSPFGARIDPIYGTGAMHSGVDFAAPQGSPIYAVADGKVVFAGSNAYTLGAQLIVIQHNVNGEEFSSWYMHSYSSGVHVREGDTVTLGQHIADVGSSGHSTGAHLHLEIHPGKFTDFEHTKPVDPEVYLKEHHAVDINAVCAKK